jgi:hypothetical protein
MTPNHEKKLSPINTPNHSSIKNSKSENVERRRSKCPLGTQKRCGKKNFTAKTGRTLSFAETV